MTQRPFVDLYEVLQLSQGADSETVERVYRLLAKRYHPDNQATGNSKRFAEVSEAYQILSDAKRRAEYDGKYDENRRMQWQIFDQGPAGDGREEDRRIFHGILSLLYVARRRDPVKGGLGTVNLEKLLGVPRQHLEFPAWYLKQRGWVEILDNGQLAITVSGVDKLADRELALPEDRLLPASSVAQPRAPGGSPDDQPGEGQPRSLEPSGEPGTSGAEAEPAGWSAAEPASPGSEFPSESSPQAGARAVHPAADDIRDARERARVVEQRLRGGN